MHSIYLQAEELARIHTGQKTRQRHKYSLYTALEWLFTILQDLQIDLIVSNTFILKNTLEVMGFRF